MSFISSSHAVSQSAPATTSSATPVNATQKLERFFLGTLGRIKKSFSDQIQDMAARTSYIFEETLTLEGCINFHSQELLFFNAVATCRKAMRLVSPAESQSVKEQCEGQLEALSQKIDAQLKAVPGLKKSEQFRMVAAFHKAVASELKNFTSYDVHASSRRADDLNRLSLEKLLAGYLKIMPSRITYICVERSSNRFNKDFIDEANNMLAAIRCCRRALPGLAEANRGLLKNYCITEAKAIISEIDEQLKYKNIKFGHPSIKEKMDTIALINSMRWCLEYQLKQFEGKSIISQEKTASSTDDKEILKCSLQIAALSINDTNPSVKESDTKKLSPSNAQKAKEEAAREKENKGQQPTI